MISCRVLYGPFSDFQHEPLSINVMSCSVLYGPVFRLQPEPLSIEGSNIIFHSLTFARSRGEC